MTSYLQPHYILFVKLYTSLLLRLLTSCHFRLHSFNKFPTVCNVVYLQHICNSDPSSIIIYWAVFRDNLNVFSAWYHRDLGYLSQWSYCILQARIVMNIGASEIEPPFLGTIIVTSNYTGNKQYPSSKCHYYKGYVKKSKTTPNRGSLAMDSFYYNVFSIFVLHFWIWILFSGCKLLLSLYSALDLSRVKSQWYS